tara:strand:- start:4104 stop:4547 length:444 start_codon:yes stop_codon:yes gene_type:complete
MTSSNTERFFTEVPNQAGSPVRQKEVEPTTYIEAVKVIQNLIKKDPELYKLYKSGNIFNNKVDNGIDLLSIIFNCYVNTLRNNLDQDKTKSTEEIQKANITLTAVQEVFDNLLKLFKDLNFNLDASSAAAIIYGIIECQLKEHIQND